MTKDIKLNSALASLLLVGLCFTLNSAEAKTVKPASKKDVTAACGRTPGCKMGVKGGDGDVVVEVNGTEVGICPKGLTVCFPYRTSASRLFPILVPDTRVDHSGEGGGNAQPQGGGTDRGGEVGGRG
jgi:hypothetical protein